MGQKVWAWRVGNFPSDSSSGWTQSIHFKALEDLVDTLEKKKLRRQVDTLAIVAHGDAGGLVQLDRNLTPGTLASFGETLTAMDGYFGDWGGKLLFVSCIAALGKDGDDLLTGLSKYLPNVHVIGFTINGAMVESYPNLPGQVYEGQNFMSGMNAKLMKALPPLTEYSPFSKWARNGYITKIPYEEQVKRPKYRCAWSLCPGHKNPIDRCVPAIKGLGYPKPYPG